MTMKLIPRKITDSIVEYLDTQEIILLIGARQVGKTSLLKIIQNHLFAKGVTAQSVYFLNLEDPLVLGYLERGVNDFLGYLRSIGTDLSRRNYILIDEIQYLSDPTGFLKLIYDEYPQLKLIVSGSSTLEIRQKFRDSLAGRKVIFELYPLDFEEFLVFKGEEQLAELYRECCLRRLLKKEDSPVVTLPARYRSQEFSQYYQEFVLNGGYPRVTLESDPKRKLVYLTDIYNSYIRKDIKDLMRIDNSLAFNNLIQLLAVQSGQMVNLVEIGTALKTARRTLERYLFLLENTFVIHLLPPFFSNRRKEVTKMRKVFFLDTGMRNLLLKSFEFFAGRQDVGALIENAVFSNLYKNRELLEDIHFWRTQSQNEVDFVLRTSTTVPIEVKFQAMDKAKVPPGIRFFLRRYPAKVAFVLTRDFWDRTQLGETTIYFIPVWMA